MPRARQPERETGACKSTRCGAAIRWLRTLDGGLVPVDYTPEPGGSLIPVIHIGQRRVRPRRPGDDPTRPGFAAHWETCVDPNAWRTEHRHANRSGALPPIDRARHTADVGPCAGCYWPEHTAYGPASGGTLCEVCREVLAAWKARPGPQRGTIPYPTWNPATRRRESTTATDDAGHQ